MGSGARVHHGHACQERKRRIVEYLAACEHAAVAVRGVLAQADVGDDEQVAASAADGAHGVGHDSVLGVPLRATLVLACRQAKEDDACDAQLLDRVRLARGFVRGEVEAAGQRLDLATARPRPARRRADRRAGWARRLSHARACADAQSVAVAGVSQEGSSTSSRGRPPSLAIVVVVVAEEELI